MGNISTLFRNPSTEFITQGGISDLQLLLISLPVSCSPWGKKGVSITYPKFIELCMALRPLQPNQLGPKAINQTLQSISNNYSR
jgi:hypothetical protein